MSRPLFSIVYPTRNRPEMLRYGLLALQRQSHTDFEVIVCDNHTGIPADTMFREFADDPRFHYITPDKPLSMPDNWEFASLSAKGRYLCEMTDKMVLRSDALEMAASLLSQYDPDVLSWYQDPYFLKVDHQLETGLYCPTYPQRTNPRPFDPKDEMYRKLRMDTSLFRQGLSYYRGQVVFGVFREEIVSTARAKLGRVFFPFSPDSSAKTVGLAFAETAYDAGEPLVMAFLSEVSNGRCCSQDPHHMLKYLHEVDPSLQIYENLPVRGLLTSTHNVTALEYLLLQERLGDRIEPVAVPLATLLQHIREDLLGYCWTDTKERERCFDLWQEAFEKLSPTERQSMRNGFRHWKLAGIRTRAEHIASGLLKAMTPKPLYPILLRGLNRPPRFQCNSILEAADFAREYYQRP